MLLQRKCRLCGRKVPRTQMTTAQLQAAIRWCYSEIAKLKKEKARRIN